MFRRAEILCFGGIERGDHVPGDATAEHMIHRREDAGDVKRFVIGRRVGRAEAEALGRLAHHHQQCRRVHLDHADAILDGGAMVIAENVGHGEAIVEKREMEFSGFERARDPRVVLRRQGNPSATMGGARSPRSSSSSAPAGNRSEPFGHDCATLRQILRCPERGHDAAIGEMMADCDSAMQSSG